MPVIVNPFKPARSPVGEAIANLAQTAFGDTLTPALKREQLVAAQRGNVETENLMRGVNTGGDLDWAALAPAIVGSGYKPADFNELVRGRAANMYGARDPRTQAAQVGAGSPFTATAEAFDIGQATDRRGQDIMSADRRYSTDVNDATERYKFDNKPLEATVGGQNVFVPQSGAFDSGVSPMIDEKASPAAVYNAYHDLWLQNYPDDVEGAKKFALEQSAKRGGGMSITTPDGTTVELGGVGAIGKPTNNVQSSLQKQSIEAESFNRLAGIADQYLEDPSNANLFGVVGKGRQLTQGLAQAANNLAITLGAQDVGQAVNTIREEAKANGLAGLIPEIYDPNLDAVDAVWAMLVYRGAAALAGQEGRSVSDKDVAMMRHTFGDPKSLLASQQALKAKLDIARRMVGSSQAVRDNAMAGKPLGAATGSTPDDPIDIQSEAEADKYIGRYVRMNGQVFEVRQ